MIKIAIQKSGRLNEESLKLIKDCGINFELYRDQLKVISKNYPIEMYFLRNGDIPKYLNDGVVDLAIIGENTLNEKGYKLNILEKLGFSKCRVSIAVPKDLKYTKDHEWVKIEDDIAIVGVTDFAQGELGDIVYVEVETVDEELDREEVFGTVEAVKTVSDLFMPISGEVVEFNESLEETPEKVNEDPYGEGWMIKIKITDSSELEDLLSPEDYESSIS